MIRARIWGCRGSLAAPGADTVRYGGNTSCISIEVDEDTMIVLDAGTGLRGLGLSIAAHPPRVMHIMLSHLHMDHLEGLGFFGPMFRGDVEIHIWGPPSPMTSLADRVARYLSPPLFPVHLSEVPSKPIFHDVAATTWRLGAAVVRAQPVSHQGPTVGYRIELGGSTLAYIPDHEPGRAGDMNAIEPSWISGHAVARGADILIHDAQYTEEEYPQKVGWGHSSARHVVDFARIAQVGRLVMFHHDPMHTDAMLERHLVRARDLMNGALPVELAHEGMELASS